MSFTVVNIIEPNKIRVSPNWKWKESSGNEVIILGFGSLNTSVEIDFTKQKLEHLLLNKNVDLKNPVVSVTPSGTICCEVYLNGVNIARYFPEFQK